MLNFTDITIEDKETMEPLLRQDQAKINERSFAGLYIWSAHYGTQKCLKDGYLFLGGNVHNGVKTYYPPLGREIVPALEEIAQDAAERSVGYRIYCVSAAQKAEIEAHAPGKYDIAEDRDNFDYIYSSEDLIQLAGKKYHSKRNFINRFLTTYDGRWEYLDINPKRDQQELMDFQRQWCLAKTQDRIDDYQFEFCAIKRALEHFEELDMRGGMIKVDGKLAAFTMASPLLTDTIDIMIEKADANIDGAYPMINREFAQRHCSAYPYINREEDMGIEGLRRAKLSYHPVELTEKFLVTPAERIT